MKFLFLLMGMLIFVCSSAAQPGAFAGRKHQMMFSDLNLSAEQQREVDSLIASKPRPVAAMMQARQLRLEMNDMIKNKEVSEQAIYNKLAEINKIVETSSRARVDHLLALRKILTTEQLEKLMLKMDQMKKQGMGGNAQGKGPGAGMGRGLAGNPAP